MKQRLSLNLDFITVPSTVAGPLSALVREGIDSAPFMGSDVIKKWRVPEYNTLPLRTGYLCLLYSL